MVLPATAKERAEILDKLRLYICDIIYMSNFTKKEKEKYSTIILEDINLLINKLLDKS